ncbi:LysR family transcriptional regulator [Gluconobacter sp. Dm-62]|uniref:LysR family transcriptional regulator n=1 Tax=Gluconobacter sp. Dm-62 TaxID=2799804 RepID=UPI002011C28D|nr:LysR family transcriptional regulator [Gluconobacter sp. Dm-62]
MMDRLGALNVFMRAAETRSFVATGRDLGISASAVGKAIARLEERLGVRLLHRSTRSMTLTAEGRTFLDHCRRIFDEVDAAEAMLFQASDTPLGVLRVSLPIAGMLLMPVIAAFMKTWPDIRMDIDFTDRMVAVIEEGFDAVIRTGEIADTRLMHRKLGVFRHRIVASPAYLAQHGTPLTPEDLLDHACLHHRYMNSGKLEPWPLTRNGVDLNLDLPQTAVVSTIEPLLYLAEQGFGVACLPPFAVNRQIEAGTLVALLDGMLRDVGSFRVLWPASRYMPPKTRLFIDFLADHLSLG